MKLTRSHLFIEEPLLQYYPVRGETVRDILQDLARVKRKRSIDTLVSPGRFIGGTGTNPIQRYTFG